MIKITSSAASWRITYTLYQLHIYQQYFIFEMYHVRWNYDSQLCRNNVVTCASFSVHFVLLSAIVSLGCFMFLSIQDGSPFMSTKSHELPSTYHSADDSINVARCIVFTRAEHIMLYSGVTQSSLPGMKALFTNKLATI